MENTKNASNKSLNITTPDNEWNKVKYTSENPYQKEIDIHNWCKEQAQLYWEGVLPQFRIDKLEAIGFDWNHYKKDK